MQNMASKDSWTVLKYLLGYSIAVLLAHLTCSDEPLFDMRQRSTDVDECLVLLNGSSNYLYCYKELDTEYGMFGQKGEQMNRPCEKCSELSKYRLGGWKPILDDYVLQVVKDLQRKAQALVVQDIPEFVSQLSSATVTNAQEVTESPLTVQTIVEILQRIADISKNITINKPEMEDILKTVDILVSDQSIKTWKKLNNGKMTANMSTKLLSAIENISSLLTDDSFTIIETFIELNKTLVNDSYSGKSTLPNSNTEILIPQVLEPTSLTIIIFTTLDSVLPTRKVSGKSDWRINGDVVVVKSKKNIFNISFAFDINNQSLGNPQCVFWNVSLDAWDSTGCEVKTTSTGNETGKITCECDHTTSFSILMSPLSIDSKPLDYITYIGVAISLASLILCLIIEAIVWKTITVNDTSYMRHVSIVNIAFSLLMADICFIIGASLGHEGQSTPVGPCSAAVFFMHFFYLALFFWMLISALLLLYRTVMVFSQIKRAKMMVNAFTVGYGAPFLIAVITVASTSGPQNYVSKSNACWLNWSESKALLAFVIPALTIVAINLVVLVVVLYKMLKRGTGATTRTEKKHTLVVIARYVAILTPIFGLTWGLGIGTMVSADLGIQVVFALLNSLQGFILLVFGILLDSKVREALAGRMRRNRSEASTFTGVTSSNSSSDSDTFMNA